jgi:hypothetical protein
VAAAEVRHMHHACHTPHPTMLHITFCSGATYIAAVCTCREAAATHGSSCTSIWLVRMLCGFWPRLWSDSTPCACLVLCGPQEAADAVAPNMCIGMPCVHCLLLIVARLNSACLHSACVLIQYAAAACAAVALLACCLCSASSRQLL